MDGRVNPILLTMLQGVYDNGSPLSKLKGTLHIAQKIWKFIVGHWKSLIRIGFEIEIPHVKPGTRKILPIDCFFLPQQLNQRRNELITFPSPNDLNINMMPFKMCREFENCFLPENLRQYWELFIQPLFSPYREASARLEEGKVCYITIHESLVGPGKSQRRPGLQIELGAINRMTEQKSSQGVAHTNDEEVMGNGIADTEFYRHPYASATWMIDIVKGGIYMATNVSESCAVWNSQIRYDKINKAKEIIGSHGNIDIIKPYIGKQTIMDPNKIYWITDRTPHESLQLKKETYQQYFKLVTHWVSHWFEDYYTKNPLGLMPDSFTRIVRGSKLEDNDQMKFD